MQKNKHSTFLLILKKKLLKYKKINIINLLKCFYIYKIVTMKQKKAFSFVELIIVVSIVILLAVIVVSISNNISLKAQNSKVKSDLQSLNNALSSYLNSEKVLPFPKWNLNFFDKDWNYIHEDFNWGKITNNKTYWVYGKITEKSLPKSFFDGDILDPRTNEYYSYWITKDRKNFEIAWIIEKKDFVFEAVVLWNYKAEKWIYSLIREYNWAHFVEDKKSYLPYNPYEKILVVTDQDWNIYRENDEIITKSWEEKTLYFSDGSISLLKENSKLKLTKLDFPKKNKLITQIKLTLDAWVIWTKATKLLWDGKDEDSSSFKIQSWDITAAVRWTVFKVAKTWGAKATVDVARWKIDIIKIDNENPSVIDEKIWDENKPYPTFWEAIVKNNWYESSIKIQEKIEKETKDKEIKENNYCFFDGEKIEHKSKFIWYTEAKNWECDSSEFICLSGSLYKESDQSIEKELKYAYKECIVEDKEKKYYACQWYGFPKFKDIAKDCLDYEEIYGTKKIKTEKSLKNAWYKLVAYAPFNKVWDLWLYIDSKYLNDENIEEKNANKEWVIYQVHLQHKPGLKWEITFFRKYKNFKTKQENFNDKWADNYVFREINWEKWIFMKPKENNRTLRYNLMPLWLKWKDFAIEISVKWGRLGDFSEKKKKYNLFYIPNDFIVKKEHNTLILDYKNNKKNITIPDEIDENKFYKILFISENGSFKWKLLWDNIEKETDIYNWGFSNDNKLIYIWTNGYGKNIWDGFINYIKIYKRESF